MKNLFVITEEEKNRILGLHESATKNHYLINEVSYGTGNWVEVDLNAKTLILNNYLEMERADGTMNRELKLNKGTKFVKGSSKFLISKGIPYQLVDDLTGIVLENLTGDVYYYCDSKRFGTNKDNIQYFGENFQSAVQKAFDDLCGVLDKEQQLVVADRDQLEKWNNYQCVINHPNAKQVKNPSGSIVYTINGETYFNNGRKRLADGTMMNYTCNDEIFKVQTKTETDGTGGLKGGQENPNVTRIKDLQTKVGVEKVDGILGPKTLKAIMDKLSQ
jgi:hypothetical protein